MAHVIFPEKIEKTISMMCQYMLSDNSSNKNPSNRRRRPLITPLQSCQIIAGYLVLLLCDWYCNYYISSRYFSILLIKVVFFIESDGWLLFHLSQECNDIYFMWSMWSCVNYFIFSLSFGLNIFRSYNSLKFYFTTSKFEEEKNWIMVFYLISAISNC
jgi:hypothetical protein